ncbi:MAG: hypothetical protein J1E33_05410 [Alistipes sp.]|nr:hypothetical protein [Alistipes sp.]
MCSQTKISSLLLIAALMCACGDMPERNMDPYTLARVGNKDLHKSDVEKVVPPELKGADSTEFVQKYINQWIIKQLKVREAEIIFPTSADDIEAQVEEYRQSLLIKKIEQYYLDKEPDNPISDSDIETYYNDHKAEFPLERTLVKGTVVALPEDFRQKNELFKLMNSKSEESQQDFRDMCIKNDFSLDEMREWVDFSDFLALLPTLRQNNYESLTESRSVQKMEADGSLYYFRIDDVLKKDEVKPLDMVRETIRQLLVMQRNAEIIRKYESNILQEATENGNALINNDIQ